MSWSMYALGTKDAVRTHVEAQKPVEGWSAEETTAFELAKSSILGVIERLSTNGVNVSAAGHGPNITAFTISPTNLMV